MKTRTVYRKTMAYSWLKLALCAVAEIVIVLMFLLLFYGLSAIGEGPGTAGFIIWLIITPLIYPMIKYFFGHRIIAGHLNAMTEAVNTEHLPLDLIKATDKEVKLLFPSFAHFKEKELDALNSVKEFYERISDRVDIYGDEESVTWFKKVVIKSANSYLAYISGACVAQIFVKPAQMQEMTLAQSLAVFFKNWKRFLADTYKVTSRSLIALTIVAVLSVALFIFAVVMIAGANFMTVVLGIALGIEFTNGIKNAFVDPVHLIKAIKLFAELPENEDRSIYNSMALLSPAFMKLLKKSGIEPDLSLGSDSSVIETEQLTGDSQE